MQIGIHSVEHDARQEDTRSYVSSAVYSDDLTATRYIWGQSALMATAGVYIFLHYITVPELLEVSPGNGRLARSVLDGVHERAFLMNLTGVTDNAHHADGIRNPRVLRQAQLLGDRHARFGGMQPRYLDFIGTVMTLAPLEVRSAQNVPADAQCQARYWRYMSHATSLLRASIGDEAGARDRIRAYISGHAAASAAGTQMYAALRARHPRYVLLAVPLLPASAQVVVADLARGAGW